MSSYSRVSSDLALTRIFRDSFTPTGGRDSASPWVLPWAPTSTSETCFRGLTVAGPSSIHKAARASAAHGVSWGTVSGVLRACSQQLCEVGKVLYRLPSDLHLILARSMPLEG